MTFKDYCSLVQNSAAESGYDYFHPSACVAGAEIDDLHVLETELTEAGEEAVALSWAESLTRDSATVFLAFRGGERRVTVLELKDGEAIDGLVIRVNPYTEVSG